MTTPDSTCTPPAIAPKPGIVPLRPLGVGEILDGAFTSMRRYPKATLGLSDGGLGSGLNLELNAGIAWHF